MKSENTRVKFKKSKKKQNNETSIRSKRWTYYVGIRNYYKPLNKNKFSFLAQNKVYGTVVDMEHHLVRKESSGFDFQEFWEYPERYASTFSLKVPEKY